MRLQEWVVAGAFALAVAVPAAAVERDEVVLELRDGSRIVGEVLEDDGAHVRVRTAGGLELDVPVEQIVNRRRDGARVPSRTDPNYSRLMFAPTGRPLARGDGYFSDYELLFPGMSYGVTDHFTLAGGISAVPGLGLSSQLFYISPQIGFEHGNKAFGAGFLFATASDEDERYSLGIAYGVGTVGSRRASLSLGLGVAGELGEEGLRHPLLMVGGQVAVGSHVALVSENWISLEETSFSNQPLGLAVRFFGDRVSADVGFVVTVETLSEGFPVPWVSVSYHFGPTRR
jgi:hypothetical protein